MGEARRKVIEMQSAEPPAAIQIPADKYWALRLAAVEHTNLVLTHRLQQAESKTTVDALMAAAGLEPGRHYNLDDQTLTATAQSGAGHG